MRLLASDVAAVTGGDPRRARRDRRRRRPSTPGWCGRASCSSPSRRPGRARLRRRGPGRGGGAPASSPAAGRRRHRHRGRRHRAPPSPPWAGRPATGSPTGSWASPGRWARRRPRTCWRRSSAAGGACGQPEVVQQRAGRAPHRARHPRRRRGRGGGDGRPGPGPHRRPVRRRPARGRRGHHRRACRTPSSSAPSRTWPRPRASWSSPCPPTAPRCSTPTSPWWRPWPPAPRPRSSPSAWARGRAGRRCWASTTTCGPPPPAVAVGRRRRSGCRSGATTRSPTPWPRPPPPWPATRRRPGRAGPGRRPAVALADAARPAPSGALVLNDTYNANPLSIEAALRALAELPAERRTAILGVMAELGDVGPAEHARLGALAAELGHPGDRRGRARLRRRAGGRRGRRPAPAGPGRRRATPCWSRAAGRRAWRASPVRSPG